MQSERLRNIICWLYAACFLLWIPIAFFLPLLGAGPSDPTRAELAFLFLLWLYPIYTGIGMAGAILTKKNWWLILGLPGPLFVLWLVYTFVIFSRL